MKFLNPPTKSAVYDKFTTTDENCCTAKKIIVNEF